mgnify:CR=1 FL=1
MQENVETLNNYGVKKIVTACPHCFHSLKNEYPQFGGNFEVKHHTEFIEELLAGGKIQMKQESEKHKVCLLYTSDAADERSSVDLGGRRII